MSIICIWLKPLVFTSFVVFLSFPSVACAVELRDDSEGGIGNITEELIRHGLVISTSAEQVL